MKVDKDDAKYAVIQAFRFANNFRFALFIGESGALALAVYALMRPDTGIGIWAGIVVAISLLIHASLEVWNFRRSKKPPRYIYERDFLMRAFDEAVGRGILLFAHQSGRMLVIHPPPVFCAHSSKHEDSFQTFERSDWRTMREQMINLGTPAAIQSTKSGSLIFTHGQPGEVGYLWRWNPMTCLAEVYEHNENSILPPGYYISDSENPRWTYYPLAGTTYSADTIATIARAADFDVHKTIAALRAMDTSRSGGQTK